MKKSNFIVIFFGIFLLTFLAFKYYFLLEKTRNLQLLNEKIEYLNMSNLQIDSFFQNKHKNANLDTLNKNIFTFNENLNFLLEKKGVITKNIALRLQDISQKFQQKIFFANDFIDINSKNILLLKSLINSAIILDKSDFIALNNQIQNLNYKNEEEIQALKISIENLKTTNNYAINEESEFLKKADNIFQNYNKLNNIQQNANNGLNELIVALNDDFNKQIKIYFDELNLYTKLFLITTIFCIIFSIYLFFFYKNNTILKSILDNLVLKSQNAVCILDKNFNIKYANDKFFDIFKFEKLNKKAVCFNEKKDEILSNLQKKEFFTIKENIELSDTNIEKNINFYKLEKNNLNYKFVCVTNLHKIKKTNLQNLKTNNEELLLSMLQNRKNDIVIYISINNFTNLKISYSPEHIKLILKHFIKTLELAISTHNINGKIFDINNNEFAILYNGNNVENDIQIINGYFSNKIFKLQDENLDVITAAINITIGISLNVDTDVNRLYQAILAHDEARQNDINMAFYTMQNQIKQKYIQNQEIINTIQYALNNNNFFVIIQPIYNITKKDAFNNFKPEIYEVLIRLRDKNGNIRMPSEFLEIAKNTLFYTKISMIVIEKTFDLLNSFSDKKFSMNISSFDIQNKQIVDFFINKLENSKNSKNLYVEILEQDDLKNYIVLDEFINKIKSFGCKVAIDDFGSGYSNYYRLLTLNIDLIKIDGNIIKQIAKDDVSYAITQTIVQIAKQQNYEIVAEFVENIEIFEKIKTLDIKYAQGYLLSKPILPHNIGI